MNKKDMKSPPLVFHYHFELENGEAIEHSVTVASDTMHSHVEALPDPVPGWTSLTFQQCEGCPLKGEALCPVALRFVEPIEKFKHLVSHTRAKISVTTQERTYVKETDLQDGLRSLFGLIMATSGCPLMEPFKPMARFHLPFSSIDETAYRVASMYLLQRFFALGPDQAMHVNMSDIQGIYDTIQRVNRGVFLRLQTVVKQDGMLNAVAILDSFAMLIPFYVKDKLETISKLFPAPAKE